MEKQLPFDSVRDFVQHDLSDQLSWLMQYGRSIGHNLRSAAFYLGSLLVVLHVDAEQQLVERIEVYPAPGLQ